MKEKPFTGAEYLESLRDGREIYIYGERVKDVTTHPAFRNSARSIARLYDALHDDTGGVLTTPVDNDQGTFTHKFFKTPRTAQDLRESRDAIAAWQRMVYGWLGRTPDYKASLLATMDANSAFYAPYQQNARDWYRKAQNRVLYLNHAIAHPPIDRHLSTDAAGDVCVHVEKETDAGIVVSGAKVVATGSALTHYNFVAHYGMVINKKEYGAVFISSMDTPGVKLISRASYEFQAAAVGSPFDYPLSSRLDENDSILVFDKALVPWENVLAYGDIERSSSFLVRSGFIPRFTLHGMTRLAVKLDFIAGMVLKAVEATGVKDFRGVQAQIGEIIAWRHLFWSLTEAMIANPTVWEGDTMQPNTEAGLAYRVLAPIAYQRIKEIIENNVASGLIYVNSSAADWKSGEIRPYLDRYLRGSHGIEAVDRIKLMKLLWDAIGSEFGGRHELYERNYAGNHEDTRIQTLMHAQATGLAADWRGFVEKCMGEYDLDGWTTPDFVNPDDISLIGRR
ncbi:4-hydroxyphenylacetate 3-hydroxylase N-terminal domain-containing protein [Mesorhizobium sp. NPDC059054]|uniref:4-hydroxyphenylacetate 3-hydroxylase N-terminal domain-containing protein n=1 Tax=Mesorhizobium sp. NPDC059054 TaxID=3346711 RepID=UPI0036C27129